MAVDRSKVLKAAQKHLAKGQLDRAIAEYERLIADDPSDPRLLLKLGDVYTKNRQLKQAADTYRKVADQYAEQGFFLKAVAVFKQILKLDSSRLDAWERLAEMYELLSLISDALATYEKVAEAYSQAGNTRRALDAMGKMAQLDPDNVATTIKYAEALSKVHRKEEAAEAFLQGAATLKRQGRIEDYIKVNERLLFHQPTHVDVARELAEMYLERRDPKHALAKLQVCFKADPRDVETLQMLARAFELLAQTDKAVSVYREMSRILADKGDPTGQVAALQKLLALDPEHAEAKQWLRELGVEPTAGPTADSVPIIDLADEELQDDDDDIIVLDDDDSGVMPLSDADSQSGARNMPQESEASGGDEQLDPQAQVEQMLSECEVFKRYHLHDKMESQLKAVLSLVPDHVGAREQLASHYADVGRATEAAAQYLAAARVPGLDPGSARDYLARARVLDPGQAEAQAFADEPPTSEVRNIDSLEEAGWQSDAGGAPSGAAAAGTEQDDDLIFLDADATDALVLEEEPVVEADGASAAFADAEEAPTTEHKPAGLDELDEDLIFEDPVEVEADAPVHDLGSAADPEAAFFGDAQELSRPADQAPFADEETEEDFDAGPEMVLEEASEEEAELIAAIEHEAVLRESERPPPETSPTADSTPVSEVVARGTSLAPEQPEDAPAAPPADEALPEEIEEVIEEADFYLQQGMPEEAAESLQDALSEHPDHPALLAKLASLSGSDQAQASEDGAAAETQGAAPAPADAEDDDSEEDDQSFALAETLAQEAGASAQAEADSEASSENARAGAEGTGAERRLPGAQVSRADAVPVADVISQFRAGVEKAVDRGDAATHYDLGIAYVEMGLHQEAIAEFKLCLEEEQRRCQANTMIGLSYLAEGSMEAAAHHFEVALTCEPSDAERLELWFELGNAKELLGNQTEALQYYEQVAAEDQDFRDVAARIERLQLSAMPNDEDAEFDAMFDNMILKD